jgi:hypothetical protein
MVLQEMRRQLNRPHPGSGQLRTRRDLCRRPEAGGRKILPAHLCRTLGRKCTPPGANVMIIIFGNFDHLSVETFAIFLNDRVHIGSYLPIFSQNAFGK